MVNTHKKIILSRNNKAVIQSTRIEEINIVMARNRRKGRNKWRDISSNTFISCCPLLGLWSVHLWFLWCHSCCWTPEIKPLFCNRSKPDYGFGSKSEEHFEALRLLNSDNMRMLDQSASSRTLILCRMNKSWGVKGFQNFCVWLFWHYFKTLM